MKKVLVTGASGFIGKRTAIYFTERGYDVLGWNRSEENGLVPIHKVNMQNTEDVEKALKEFCPDIIVHCAGSADVGKSVENPDLDYEGNVSITHILLFALHRLGLERTRFVYLSSAGVYGNPQSLPITEDTPLNPLSPYAIHKVMCELLCKYFSSNYNMNIKIARIFSAYGTGLRKQIFWDMFSKYTKYGKLDMFGTGNESRDYIHVDDVAQSLYLLANTESCDLVYNVANGEEITIKDATYMFADCLALDHGKISFNGIVREGDPLNWKADISRIQNLGYEKTVDMNMGLGGYIKWAKELDK